MNERLRVLVVDDELIARRRVMRLLSAMPDVVIAGECDSGEEMLGLIGDVDVVLLDVQMPGLSGLEALQLIPSGGPYVIFCTAHDQHALGAYDAGAIDYVLKPVDAQRLRLALSRARSRSQRTRFSAELERQHHAPFRRLALESARGIVLVDPEQVSSLSLEGELVTVRTTQGNFLSTLPLNELHERLPQDRFERVHRRAVLNLAHVDHLSPLDTGGLTARMKDGTLIEVSRQCARTLRKKLGI